jgi:hypothetical protein
MHEPVYKFDRLLPAAPETAGQTAPLPPSEAASVFSLPAKPTRPARRRLMLWATGLSALLLAVGFIGQRKGWFPGQVEPGEVARAQIEDLAYGHLRAAYELFSARYREQVPFETWRELALTHRRIFLTRELYFDAEQDLGGRALLQAHVVVQSGDRYLARFTLIRVQGRWWVDDLHWSREPDDRRRITV